MSSHPHDHDHGAQGTGARALGIAAALTGGMMLAEFVGGWWANSLAMVFVAPGEFPIPMRAVMPADLAFSCNLKMSIVTSTSSQTST